MRFTKSRTGPLAALTVIAFLAGATFGSVSVAEAHQSGCHRWHSCPSDTGSYVCGDLGYECQYPSSPSPVRDRDSYGQYLTQSEIP